MPSPAITIITATHNSATTIKDCIASVAAQSVAVEHIICDGDSEDDTLDIVRSMSSDLQIISEPDNGMYDAMNKGILLAKGDVVGILNSDDFYAGPFVLEKVTDLFRKGKTDAVFADLVYVRSENIERIVRYYSGADFTIDKFARGWMPPHPTLFLRRKLYELYGLFHTDYKIAADFELTTRLLARYRVKFTYLPEVIVRMRTGGISTRNLHSNWILNQEILRACAENGVATNTCKIYAKYFIKIKQLFKRPT